MRLHAILLTVPLVLAVACSSDDSDSSETGTPGEADETTETTTAAPTTLVFDSAPPTTTSGSEDPDAPTGTILMVKLSVGDVEDAEEFYGNVFGATLAMKMGDTVRILTFPDGGPGLIVGDGPGMFPGDEGSDEGQIGAFIIQVPDLAATQALAVANGATVQASFEGTPTGQAAQSVDLLDPWGNQVEILQFG